MPPILENINESVNNLIVP